MKLGRYLTQQTEDYILSVKAVDWQKELEKAAIKYHIAGSWMAIVLNPLFVITDVINIPEYWKLMLVLRLSVSIVTIVVVFFWRFLYLRSYSLIAIPFLLIAFQESYAYSLIGADQILAHSVNYVTLLIGGGMFIIWKWKYSVGACIITFCSTFVFAYCNPLIPVDVFLLKGGLILITVAVFMVFLIETRRALTLKEIKARLALVESNKELVKQKDIIEEKNERITSSITAAKRIQDAILGSRERLNICFNDSFIFFQPKDVLSGDFYWFYYDEKQDVKIVIVGDCTGHGVPAALTTVLGSSILNEIIIKHNITQPDAILNLLDQKIIENFTEGISESASVNDGMDVGVLVFKDDKIYFSGANSPLFYISEGKIHQIKGSRFPIGCSYYEQKKKFDLEVIDRDIVERLFLFSDGFPDQLGGENDRKYLKKNYRSFLEDTSVLPINEQGGLLVNEFIKWKGDEEQTDDVLVVGIQL